MHSIKDIRGNIADFEKKLKAARVFLTSKDSDYITGQNIFVDGGFTIW